MSNIQVVPNVPPAQVTAVIAGFYAAGAINVQSTQQADGNNYTVTATFPSVQIVPGVPQDQLQSVVDGFKAASATNVHTTKQADGNYSVAATF